MDRRSGDDRRRGVRRAQRPAVLYRAYGILPSLTTRHSHPAPHPCPGQLKLACGKLDSDKLRRAAHCRIRLNSAPSTHVSIIVILMLDPGNQECGWRKQFP